MLEKEFVFEQEVKSKQKTSVSVAEPATDSVVAELLSGVVEDDHGEIGNQILDLLDEKSPGYSSVKEIDHEKTLGPEEQLKSFADKLRVLNPEKPADVVQIVRILTFVKNHNLYLAMSCSTFEEFIIVCEERFGCKRATFYAYLRLNRLYKKYESFLAMRGIGYLEDLACNNLITKMPLLDTGLTRFEELGISQNDVFDHFLNDSLKEFDDFVHPEKRLDQDWLKVSKEWKKSFTKEFKSSGGHVIVIILPDMDSTQLFPASSSFQ